MKPVVTTVITVIIVFLSAPARADRADYSVVTLFTETASITLDPRVQNNGPAIVEARVARRLNPWLTPDAGLALISFPDQVPELRLGLRAHPLPHVPYARALFARVGVHTLVSIAGFDVAPDLEMGVAAERSKVILYVAGTAGYYLIGPRVMLGVRAGFGFRL